MGKIVVTGASGFVGKHLVRRLCAEGYAVSAIVRPSTDVIALETMGIDIYEHQNDAVALYDYFKAQQVEGCIHLASTYSRNHTTAQVNSLLDTNLKFGTQCLEAAAQAGLQWFVNTGTFWQHYENHVYSPVNLYAATKQAFESIMTYYQETTPLQIMTLMLSDTYGPEDSRSKIMNLWDQYSQNGNILGMSPGEQFVDIVYIDDVVDAYLRLLKLLETGKGAQLRGRQFAIGSGNMVSLKALATIFSEVVKRPLKINWGELPYHAREVMIPWNQGDAVPGWKAKIGFEEGIQRTFCRKDTK